MTARRLVAAANLCTRSRVPGRLAFVSRCVLGAALVATLAAAQETNDTAKSYSEVEAAFSAGLWKQAHEKILALVKDHQNDAYLLAHSDELTSMMSECDFRQSYKVPDIQAFFKGKTSPFDRKKSELEVSYVNEKKGRGSADTLSGIEDFQKRGEKLTFPVLFTGPYQISVKGEMPASGLVGRQPEIVVCHTEKSGVRFTFTWPTTNGPGRQFDIWSLGSVFLTEDGKERQQQEDNQLGVKYSLMYGAKYDLKVTVSKSDVTATIHGIKFLTVERPQGDYGSLTLGWCPNIAELVISGTIDRKWVDAAYENHVNAARKDFMKSYDPAKVLPAWLHGAGASAPPSAPAAGPGSATPAK
jgi:hypothetical protein